MCLIIKIAYLLYVILIFEINATEELHVRSEYAQGRFPYRVWIRHKHLNESVKHCCGAILNNRFILTSADCVDSVRPKDIKVHIRSEFDNIHIKINHIKYHEHFNPKTLCNNLALLKAHTDITLSSFIQPINLPSENITLYGRNELISLGSGLKHVSK